MGRISWLIMGFVLVVMVTAVSMAVHYRRACDGYREECERLKALPAPETVNIPGEVRTVYVAKTAPGGSEEVLKARIRELEGKLADTEAQLASANQTASNRPPESPRRGPDTMALRTRGTNDVARRAEFDKRREEFQQQVQSAFARKAAFLVNRDTSKLSETEKKEYEQMVTLLDETWKISAQMQADLPADQRREVMHTLRDNVRTLEPLLTSERAREFRDLGTSLGYNEAEAAQLSANLTDIIDATSVSTLFPQFPGRGGFGGDRGRAQPPSPPATPK